MLALTCTLSAGAACATEPHPHVGRLPGFPAMRGVIPVLGSSAAVARHEKLVEDAFATARARRSSSAPLAAEPNEEFFSECKDESSFFSTQDVCYRGGPVLHDPTIHLIFWQGPTAPLSSHTELFPPHYMGIVERYFSDLAHANATPNAVLNDTFAVEPQYYDEDEGNRLEGSSGIKFESPTDVEVDNSPFPTHTAEECDDVTSYSEGPCLLDGDLQAEVARVAKTTAKGLGDIYVVLTPPGVGGCFEESSGECAYRQYCAYHGDFGGDGFTPGQQTIYADLPYLGKVFGCDSGVHPNEAFSAVQEEEAANDGELLDEGADAVIDTANHEINEAISDPIGSQCRTGATRVSECERNAWTDAIGQEIADKCLPPESTLAGTYGEPLGEVVPGHQARAYNQLIEGDPYWVQRVWSDEAGLAEGACVQRRIEASFSVSASRQATVPMTLDGSPSGAPGDPAVYWVWDILESGEQFGSASPTLSHAFAQPGSYLVALTAYDAYGNSQAIVGEFTVGVAPAPTPLGAPTPMTVVLKESVAVAPSHLDAGQVAARLGLPADGKKLSGSGPFTLGHGQCPPACGVTIRLYAKATSAVHGRHTNVLVLIGSARTRPTARGGLLSLSLNAKGRSLLRRGKALSCKLVVSVEGQEGGSWQIDRSLTLAGAHAARRARR